MAEWHAKTISSWVLVALLAAGYLMSALGKLTGAATQMFEGWGYAPWFATLIGVLELLGAIGLLIPRLRRAAILGLTGVMIGAFYTHIANGEGAEVWRPLLFLALLWIAWWLQRGHRPEAADAA